MKKLIIILIIILFGWLIGRDFWWRTPMYPNDVVVIEIEEGSGVSAIADQLKDADIIGSPFLFKVYTKLTASESKLLAGEYMFAAGMSASDVLKVLKVGQEDREISLTFIEGWTLSEMGVYVAGENVVSREEWNTAATRDLEGYLFPDTYRFFADVEAKEVVKKMRDTMTEKITVEMRADMDAQGKSLHQILTMASIIEREVRSDDDRKAVSDIFWKRVSIGMALQADSTVNYITGKKTPAISFEDRDINSPYNTYQNRGLPPGPISNPGLSSIEAAIYPASNNYYFFLTDEEGNVHYGTTLDEHNVNKARYLK